ncbi:MAG TPA: sulfotransferase [Streptosporangiaceae bacterium]
MKVIGAGFARTGTATLTAALKTLGFGPCYHMFEVMERPERVRQWLAAAEGRPDWDEIFAGFESAVDWPVAAYWRELADHYPDAKIILTVRDPQRWYDSAAATVFQFRLLTEHYPGKAVGKLLALANPHFANFLRMADVTIWNGVLDGRFPDRAYALDVFERHIDEVRKSIPADRLLVYDVAEGWQPLCDFLGVPVPAGTAFPNVNDTAAFQRFRRGQMARLAVRPVAAILGTAVALTYLTRRLARRRH